MKTNPNSVAGTVARSHHNAKIVGGVVGKGIGSVAGKISNRVSPPKIEKGDKS